MNHLDDPAEASDPGRHVAIIGRSVMNSTYSIVRSRGASSWLLTWTLDGAGRLSHDGATVDAEPHDLVILGTNVRQRYGTLGDRWEFSWFHFQPRPAWLALVGPWRVGDALYRTSVDGEDDVRRISGVFDRAFGDVRPRGGAFDPNLGASDPPSATGRQTIQVSPVETTELLLNAIEQILLVASRNARQRAGAPGPAGGFTGGSDVLVAIERTIVADPAAPHTVASLAAASMMSPSHFAHAFKRRTGRTPMEAVRAERLSLAVQLLRSTDLQVAQVAKAVGYPDPYYFSRLFHRHLGVPPSAYANAATDNHRFR